MKNRVFAAAVLAVAGSTLLGGCVYRSSSERVVPTASPAAAPATVIVAPAQRVVTYPEGRYQLMGSGTVSDPYYWVWIPVGANPPNPPPLPRLPQQ